MKVILLTHGFPPSVGGVQNLLYNFCIRLRQFNVVVFAQWCPGCKKFDCRNNLKISRYHNLFSFLPYRIRVLLFTFHLSFLFIPLAVLESPDLVWIGLESLSLQIPGKLISLLLGIPMVTYVHGDFLPQEMKKTNWSTRLTLFLLRQNTHLLTNSFYTKSRLEKVGVPSEMITVVSPGVDVDSFVPGDKSRARQEIGLPSDGYLLLTVGRLDSRKNHAGVIRALAKLREDFPNLHYLICGDGDNLWKIKSLVKEYGVEDRVIFLGSVTDSQLVKYYQACDLFVMPNVSLAEGDTEGLGMVFLEAAASEKPVIAGKAGGAPETLINGKTGFVVNGQNCSEIAEKVASLLRNPQSAIEMGRQGRKMVAERFNWKRQASLMESVFMKEMLKKA